MRGESALPLNGIQRLNKRVKNKERIGQGISMDDWQQNLITKDADILELARSSHRVAVLGIRSEKRADRAAFYVPQYLASAGVEVVPVPVYEKDVEIILGQKVYRDLISIPGEIDLV